MTIKANELRIGNLIWISDTITLQLYREVEKVNIHHLIGLTGWKNPIVEIEPIPLTEEWLVRFGFFINHWESKNINEKVYQFGGFTIFYSELTNNWCFTDMEFSIEYTHQLQNLYFALTGQELELSPN